MDRTAGIKNNLVLLVEDDHSLREATSSLLQVRDFMVQQAENGREAIELLRAMPERPCLIVLDLAMPVMDGREFLKIRACDPILRTIPVIVISGDPPPQPLDDVLACLRKPVDSEELFNVMEPYYRGCKPPRR